MDTEPNMDKAKQLVSQVQGHRLYADLILLQTEIVRTALAAAHHSSAPLSTPTSSAASNVFFGPVRARQRRSRAVAPKTLRFQLRKVGFRTFGAFLSARASTSKKQNHDAALAYQRYAGFHDRLRAQESLFRDRLSSITASKPRLTDGDRAFLESRLTAVFSKLRLQVNTAFNRGGSSTIPRRNDPAVQQDSEYEQDSSSATDTDDDTAMSGSCSDSDHHPVSPNTSHVDGDVLLRLSKMNETKSDAVSDVDSSDDSSTDDTGNSKPSSKSLSMVPSVKKKPTTLMKDKKPSKEPRKGRLSAEAGAELQNWLIAHFDHPYPSDSEKRALAKKLSISFSQVNYWFINARVRLWRPLLAAMCGASRRPVTLPLVTPPLV